MLMRNSNEIHNYALTRANIAPLQATTQTRRSYVTVRCKDRRHAVFECLRWRLNMARPHAPPPPSECHAAPLQHLDTLADIATARAASEQTHPLVGAVPFVAPLPSSHRVTTTGASIPECWWRPERRACAHRGHRQNVVRSSSMLCTRLVSSSNITFLLLGTPGMPAAAALCKSKRAARSDWTTCTCSILRACHGHC
jgi:hypothetical protein